MGILWLKNIFEKDLKMPEIIQNKEVPLSQLEAAVGYTFKNKELLSLALTHTSYVNEMSKTKDVTHRQCNERLEFLGDSVLQLVATEYLYGELSSFAEGDLTRLRAGAVCEEALSEYARKISLGDHLLLGRGEQSGGGRDRNSILADAFEALLGAMYLDSEKDLSFISRFVLKYLGEKLETLLERGSTGDPKTLLQQYVQSVGERLHYVVTGTSGPDHQKIFNVEARLNSNVIGKGSGHSKREAEQEAARAALKLFGEK